MRRLALTALVLVAFGPMGHAEENRGSAGYMLPLCRTWLNVAVEQNAAIIRSILTTDPIRLTTSGMCAGVVIGIMEALRTFELSCPPQGVTNEQLVRMVVKQIEKHPEQMHQDFVVPAAAVMVAAWPCRK